MEKIQERFNWELLISAFLMVGSIVGTTVPLYVHSSNEMASMRQSTEAILREGQQEMKDFHGRLEHQDAEFRGRMEKIESDYRNGLLLLEEKIRR